MADFLLGQAGVFDRLLHRDVVIRRTVTHEAPDFAVDMLFQVDIDFAVNMAAESALLIFLDEFDPGTPFLEGIHDFRLIVPKRRDDAHSGNNDAPASVHAGSVHVYSQPAF